MEVLRRYRPRVLAPFAWDTSAYRILDTGFETALRQFTERLRDGWAPTLRVDRTRLRLTIGRRNGSMFVRTPDEPVLVTQPTGGTVDWTATGDKPWLSLTRAGGHGNGIFQVGINPDAASLLDAGFHHAAIVVSAPGSIEGLRTLEVELTVSDEALLRAPIGIVDTPSQNATGVVGAIGVTGWVVDDVGVRSVKIYRNCMWFEPAIDCGIVRGLNLVYIGDATIVAGARPDIETAYPTYPQNYRAAWGYLLLTNLLPHVTNRQVYGGQGPVTLHVLAEDLEGQVRWLGRGFLISPTLADEVPTTLTMANDTIAKPFGAIDTPAQGQTVSDQLWNFGWTLTPNRDTTADSGDILMPLDGSTQWVYVDGTPLATLGFYNLCRGLVSSPVPAGAYCDDDISNIFGNPSPLPTYTPRSANPTRYRNLDAGRGAIAAYFLDPATLANGLHTIVWGVSDSAGRSEGIGSRYFTVLNGSFDSRPAGTALAQDKSFDSRPAGTALAQDKSAEAALRAAPAQSRGDARMIEALAPAAGRVWGRTGFDVAATYEEVTADDAGVRHVQLPDLGRLELWLGAVEGGYLAANGTLRDLPPGSHLDPGTGHFTWAPGVGYFGTYRLIFAAGHAQTTVDVTIRPVTPSEPGEREVRMFVDAPRNGDTISGAMTVAGWALDPKASIASGIDAVHVWAQRRDVPAAQPEFLGAAALGGTRPDVARVHGATFGTAGFSLTFQALEPGAYDITVFARSRRTARWEDARTIAVWIR